MRAVVLFLIAGGLFAQPVPNLVNLRQLTNGGQNAEAYWAPDGKRLVFQSTREPYGCDQIFVMNDDGSNQRLISTGKGRTTCAYFLKDNKHIVYASTHEGGDACPASPDRSRGYVWPVYPTYDLFLATDEGKIVKKLTAAAGYDAEATVNWKTNKIVYTSMASGDLDLWTMNPDGTGKRQLTKSLGYDGGAFFSPDGKQLVWRGNHPATPQTLKPYQDLLKENLTTPMKMEIMVSAANGDRPRRLTNFNCASFAPVFTPDGKKILFSSNKHECDSRKFELYLMNADGSNVQQVTNFGGFTSFAEFSPDGKRLVFASDYQAKGRYEFNIFVAGWK